jgi:hypothetical protein
MGRPILGLTTLTSHGKKRIGSLNGNLTELNRTERRRGRTEEEEDRSFSPSVEAALLLVPPLAVLVVGHVLRRRRRVVHPQAVAGSWLLLLSSFRHRFRQLSSCLVVHGNGRRSIRRARPYLYTKTHPVSSSMPRATRQGVSEESFGCITNHMRQKQNAC